MLLNCFRTILQHQTELFFVSELFIFVAHVFTFSPHYKCAARETSQLVYYLHIRFASIVCIFSPLPLLFCALLLLPSLCHM